MILFTLHHVIFRHGFDPIISKSRELATGFNKPNIKTNYSTKHMCNEHNIGQSFKIAQNMTFRP